MPLSYNNLFAKRLNRVGSSAIRDLLRHAGKKDFISCGGGYPAPESFPVEIIKSLETTVIKKYGPNIFQYGATEGFNPLLEVLPKFLLRKNRLVACSPENIAITSGSQQALDVLGKVFINRGDKVAVESPTYLGALQAFNAYEPEYIEVETDNEGMTPKGLKKTLIKNPDIKFIYLIPTFQNPTGKTASLKRRKEIAKILKRFNKIAIEDDPYSEIRYEGEHIQSIKSLIPKNVIYLFTFSKTLAPDFRIGGMVAPIEVIQKVNLIKQGIALYTSNFSQAVVAEYLTQSHIDKHIPKIISLYKPRRNIMVQSIKKYFPDVFDFVPTEGGMFIWAYLKSGQEKNAQNLKIEDVLHESVMSGVSFVAGSPFFAKSRDKGISMRLNFSNQSEYNIEKGIKIIGKTLHKHLS